MIWVILAGDRVSCPQRLCTAVEPFILISNCFPEQFFFFFCNVTLDTCTVSKMIAHIEQPRTCRSFSGVRTSAHLPDCPKETGSVKTLTVFDLAYRPINRHAKINHNMDGTKRVRLWQPLTVLPHFTMAYKYNNELLAPYLALPQGDKVQAECS